MICCFSRDRHLTISVNCGRARRFAVAALAFFVISQSFPIFANSSFTLSAWIRPKSVVPSAPVVVCTSDAAQWPDGFGLYLDESGRVSSYAGAATNPLDRVSGPVPSCGLWQHACLVFEGGIAALYFNGVLQGSATNGLDSVSCDGDVFVGDDGFAAFDGEITLMDFLPEALSSEDVAALWHEAASASAPPSATPQPAVKSVTSETASASDAVPSRLAERLRNLGCVSTRQRPSPKPRLRVFTEFAR